MSELLDAARNVVLTNRVAKFQLPVAINLLGAVIAAEDERLSARNVLARLGYPTLTTIQLELVMLISEYIEEHHVSPTLQELADIRGVGKVTVHEHVKALEKKGAIRRNKHQARSIKICWKGN